METIFKFSKGLKSECTPDRINKRFFLKKINFLSKRFDHYIKKHATPFHIVRFVGVCYQRLLYCATIVLSLVILAVAAVYIYARVQDYIHEQAKIFFAQKDAVVSAIEHEELHLKGVLGFYKISAHLQSMFLDDFLTAKYQRLLRKNDGVAVVGSDVANERYLILSTLTKNKDASYLKQLLSLVTVVSPMSGFHLAQTGIPLSGFIYDTSKSFSAISPSDAIAKALYKKGISNLKSFILQETGIVEKELAKYSPGALKAGQIVWIPFHWNKFTGKTVGYYASALFQGNKRLAVVVFNIWQKDFSRFFLNKGKRIPNFFVIARNRLQLFGIKKDDPRQMRYANIVLQYPELFWSDEAKMQLIKKEGVFFFAQHILNPDWVTVYALDWHMILSGIKKEIIVVLLLVSSLLTFLWLFVFIFERYIFSPIQAKSQRVYESEQFNKTIISTAPVGLSVIDAETGKVVIKNDIAAQLLSGHSHSEGDKPSYKKLLTAYHDIKIKQRASQKAQQNIFYNEIVTVRKNGKQGHIAVSFSESRYQGREVVLCGLNDISSRKETERLLLEAKRSADHASQAKSMFLASMGHEIRTPLYGALGHLELLSREMLKPSQKDLVGTIYRSFESLLTLLNDILDFSKSEAGELKLEFSTLNLIDLIESCARTFAPLILKKGVHFFCLLDPRLRDRLIGNSDRLQQVLMNLLSNATKFTDVGKIVLRVDVLEESDGQCRVRFQIVDSGIGIARQDQQKLFFPFTQANTTVARHFGGTGLGLSLCKKLCELMGGTIALISEEGFGSVFTVELPFSIPEQAKEAEQSVANLLAKQTVVLVCNTALWRDSLIERFEFWGATVNVDERMEKIDPIAFPDSTLLVIAQHAMSNTNKGAGWINKTGGFLSPNNLLLENLQNKADYLDSDSESESETCFSANPGARLSRETLRSYIPIIISADGPYQPEYRHGALYVSSLSLSGLKKAIALSMRDMREREERDHASAWSSPAIVSVKQCPPDECAAVAHNAAILVVEDDAVNRKLLSRQLTAIGYPNVEEATDGREALSKCKTHAYDVVLTDLSMPYMDGFNLVKALRNAKIQTPVILVTASLIAQEEIDHHHKGVTSILYKPISIVQLKNAIEKIFAKRINDEKNEVITTNTNTNTSPAILPVLDKKTTRARKSAWPIRPTQQTQSRSQSQSQSNQWIDIELKEIFIQSWQNDLPRLQQAFRSKNNKALLRQLHKLKGALMVMNEQELFRLCTKIQHTCAAKGIEAIQSLYEDLEKWMADIVQKYKTES